MPARSARQYRMMQAVAHGRSKGIGGISKGIAKEFIRKTNPKKRSMFARSKY